ncbi:MAG: hypothetical protein ACM3TR_14860 [Caulobacteraceae bacterium]
MTEKTQEKKKTTEGKGKSLNKQGICLTEEAAVSLEPKVNISLDDKEFGKY